MLLFPHPSGSGNGNEEKVVEMAGERKHKRMHIIKIIHTHQVYKSD